MPALRAKSERLTAYMEFVLRQRAGRLGLRQITPVEPEDRGCQLSLLTDVRGKALFEHLSRRGVICDWREPDVIRLAPVPLYNSFEDVYQLGQIMDAFTT